MLRSRNQNVTCGGRNDAVTDVFLLNRFAFEQQFFRQRITVVKPNRIVLIDVGELSIGDPRAVPSAQSLRFAANANVRTRSTYGFGS